jgi:hypothetical protein
MTLSSPMGRRLPLWDFFEFNCARPEAVEKSKRMRATLVQRSLLTVALALSLHMGLAQDFHKTYPISAGGQIVIGNSLGNIKVVGYKGDSIEVLGFKRGSGHEAIEIADNSSPGGIELFPRYPNEPGGGTVMDLEVRVPIEKPFNFSRLFSYAGDVEVSNVKGRVRVRSVKGKVEVKDVSGLVFASSVSGDVNAEINRSQGRSDMRFSSISGNIRVLAPAKLEALIDMSSATGLLRSDFPIEIQERRYGPGRTARGRLGSGTQILHITSVSGSVSLLQKQ